MSIASEIAVRFLRAKKRRSLLSLISVLAVGGVGVGVAALVVVLAVLAGFETSLKEKLMGLNAHVTVYRNSYRSEGNIVGWPEVAESIRRVPGVVSALPFITGQAMAGTSMGANGVMITGLDPEAARAGGYFDHLNLSPLAEENLTVRPMVSPWAGGGDRWTWSDDGLGVEDEPFPELAPADGEASDGDEAGASDEREFGAEAGGGGEDGVESASPHDAVPHDAVPDGAAPEEAAPEEPPPPVVQRPLILGRDLALMLQVDALDQVNVVSPFGRVTPLGNRGPLMRTFTVAGTFRINFHEFDSRVMYTTLEEAAGLLGMSPGQVTSIEVYVEDIYRAREIRSAILDVLGRDEYMAVDWMERNLSLFSALKLEQTAMFVIMTLIILVAAFNIASTLIMMVTEKTRDIAILKAMGAPASSIRRIFTIQGLLVGGVGTFGGLVVGLILCLLLKRYEFISIPPEIYLMNTLPVEIRPVQVTLITVVSILISWLATVYPASQAAKLDPVEALRYE